MEVSCLIPQLIVYYGPLSVSKSGPKSWSCLRYFAYASRLQNWGLGGQLCTYTYLGSTPSILDVWAPSLSQGSTGAFPCWCGIGSGVRCVSRSGGGAPVPLHLQRVWGFCTVPRWQRRQPSDWFSPNTAGCLSIAGFTSLCQGNSTACFFSHQPLAPGCLIRYWVPSIMEHENPPSAILAIYKARRMSDWSSCNRPPCHTIVADMMTPTRS